MEFCVRLTVSEHGRDPDSGVRLLEAAEALAPDTAPVADQNLVEGDLSIALSIDARDAGDAIEQARPLLERALGMAGFTATRLTGVEVSPAPIAEPTAPAA